MEIGIELRTTCFETMINYRLSQKLKLLGDSEFSLHLGSAFSSESVFFLVSCTVHGIYKYLHSTTFSLKLGLTALFTHLKIILL